MDPIKLYADTVVADAIKAGTPKEEAEALRPAAEEEGRKIAAHPLFQGFEKHARTRFTEHDELKKEVAPLKTAAQRLKEIEDKGKSDLDRVTGEVETLKPKAARAEALEAEVQAVLDEATAGLTDEQKAVIVGDTPEAKLAHVRKLKAAGMLGEAKKSTSPGGKLPGDGGGQTMKRAVFDRLSPAQKMEFSKKGGVLTD